MGVLNTSNKDFEREVLRSKEPVLVSFGAVWSGPTKFLKPTIEQLSNDYQGRVKVVAVDVDQEQELGSNHNVRNLPTLITFRKGVRVADRNGLLQKGEIVGMVEEVLA